MHYYLTLACGHGLGTNRKVFSPRIGDWAKCRLCRGQPQVRVVKVANKQETEDGKTYNE